MPVKMIEVKSSNLKAVGYVMKDRELTVEFRTGGKYVYEAVPPEIFATMMTAPSIGRYFLQEVRGKFQGRQA